MVSQSSLTQSAPSWEPLDFLWLELTNQCNLKCVHCYAESGPTSGTGDLLSTEDYENIITEAYKIGCRRIQFIGGEPTLNRDLSMLIKLAAETGYSFIEVFTNLTRLTEDLIACFKLYGVHVATSVHASLPETHDQITQTRGSFDKTTLNLRKLLDAGIPLRAGLIEMAENVGQTESTLQFLNELGIENAGTDRLRHFGRGASDTKCNMSELCGNCAGNTLCVGPDGMVSPCIMSKYWAIGSVLDTPLVELVKSQRLSDLRNEIYNSVVEPRIKEGGEIIGACTPQTCGPYSQCPPSTGCSPWQSCYPCFPNSR